MVSTKAGTRTRIIPIIQTAQIQATQKRNTRITKGIESTIRDICKTSTAACNA